MASEIEVRIATADDWPAFVETMIAAFGSPPGEPSHSQWERVIDFSKMLVATEQAGRARDGGRDGWLAAVRHDGAGWRGPIAGVTMVTVRPTHRRRGILRGMMTRQLNDLHARGRRRGVLWASESVIYQRFGYGIAAFRHRIEIERGRGAFLRAAGSCRQRALDRATGGRWRIFPDVLRHRRSIPASLKRTPLWWGCPRAPRASRRHR